MSRLVCFYPAYDWPTSFVVPDNSSLEQVLEVLAQKTNADTIHISVDDKEIVPIEPGREPLSVVPHGSSSVVIVEDGRLSNWLHGKPWTVLRPEGHRVSGDCEIRQRS